MLSQYCVAEIHLIKAWLSMDSERYKNGQKFLQPQPVVQLMEEWGLANTLD